MPTKRLPPNPDLNHLKAQARDLLAACSESDPTACQRMREFHPSQAGASDAAMADAALRWSNGLFAIAREYGFASWARLKAHVEAATPGAGAPSLIERIEDPWFRRAVEAIDDGDLAGLGALLDAHPDLVSRRARFEGENYFRAPSLLAFVAENPVRNDALPPNIVELARLLLERGAAAHRGDVEETLGLVASGRVAREAGVQNALLSLLVAFGAAPETALAGALVHGEFAAVARLLELGAPMTLAVAAGLGDLAEVERLLAGADGAERHFALALSAQHGRAAVLRLLLDAGEDPNRFNPPGAHSHSTPLHQAACYGHAEAVRTLLDHGARTDLRDTMWDGTAGDWARHTGQAAIADMLAGKDG